MKKLGRIISIILMIIIATTTMAMATTDNTYAATKATVPGTCAKADARVVKAYTQLGFKTKIDSSVSYAGVFSVAQHAIIVKKDNATYVLHELGHFVACLEDKADLTSEFQKIYKAEAKKYDGSNKAYITKNSKEYFAQSFAEYTLNPTKLQKSRPQTYTYVKKQVNNVTDSDVDSMYSAYGWAW